MLVVSDDRYNFRRRLLQPRREKMRTDMSAIGAADVDWPDDRKTRALAGNGEHRCDVGIRVSAARIIVR